MSDPDYVVIQEQDPLAITPTPPAVPNAFVRAPARYRVQPTRPVVPTRVTYQPRIAPQIPMQGSTLRFPAQPPNLTIRAVPPGNGISTPTINLANPAVQTTYIPPVYTLQQMESQLVIINNNIKAVFDVVMALSGKVDRMEKDMQSVKAYIDIEKEMLPVLIANKDNNSSSATRSKPTPTPPPPPAVPETDPLTPIKPCSIPLIRMDPTIIQGYTNRSKRSAPKPARYSNTPTKRVTHTAQPSTVIRLTKPMVVKNGHEEYTIVEETVDELENDPELMAIDDMDPLMDVPHDFIIESKNNILTEAMIDETLEQVVRVMENEPEMMCDVLDEVVQEEFNPWKNFKVISVTDFENKNRMLTNNPKLRGKLKLIFDSGADSRLETFTKWFSDEFLDEAVWTCVTQMSKSKQISGTPIAQVLQNSWSLTDGAFADFIRLQLYNAKTRMSKKRADKQLSKAISLKKDASDSKKSWMQILNDRNAKIRP